MSNQRHKGYVLGSDIGSEGRQVWKVRVKDPTSSHDGQKIVVASVRGGLELARGLNINFAIGTMDDPTGTKVLRAVDICLETPEGETESHVNRSGGQS